MCDKELGLEWRHIKVEPFVLQIMFMNRSGMLNIILYVGNIQEVNA